MSRSVAIIGGGASALMLACTLDPKKFKVSIYEKNATPGRKFLVAGDGGLNLTHSEDPELFISRYTPSQFLQRSFKGFNNRDLVTWLSSKGIETFIGSSGRIFPKRGMKPIAVLNTFLEIIKKNKVSVLPKYEWKGFTPKDELIFEHMGKDQIVKSDLVIFCLGGASWPVTGSTGTWAKYFIRKNINVNPFEPSNCSFKISWPAEIKSRIAGKALKNCAIRCAGKTVMGEVVLTTSGIEGSGIYPLSPQIREQLENSSRHGVTEIMIDLKPTLSVETILQKINKPAKDLSYTKQISEQLNLNVTQMTLLKNLISKEDFLEPDKLAKHIKNLRLEIIGTGSLDEAISTVGGIALNEINQQFELKKMPNHFVVGEMLDYDAPTGGYLLQSCFTMAKSLADFLNSPTPINIQKKSG